MVDQTSASAVKPATSANGAGIKWQQTVEGRAKLSEAQVRAHKEHPRSTTPASEETLKRLGDLVKGGATVKDAAALVKMGYSTAQRYLRAVPKKAGGPKSATKSTKTKKTSTRGVRLSPEQIKGLSKLVPKMGPNLLAKDIAQRLKCHVSSVYTYRSKLLNGVTPGRRRQVTEESAQQGLSIAHMADLKEAYEKIWEDVHKNQVEPTNGELYVTRVYRRMTGRG